MKNTNLELQKEISPLVRRASNILVNDSVSLMASVELLSLCNVNLDKAKTEKETITKPARAIIKRENERWAPIIDPLENAIVILRTKQSEYQTHAARVAREQEDKIIARVAPGKGNLSTETAIKKMEDIVRPQTEIKAQAGTVAFRDHKVLKIITLSDIPMEYFDLNESKVLNALKAGINVPGTALETVKIAVNKR